MNSRRLRLGALSLATALAGILALILLLRAFSSPGLRLRVDLSGRGAGLSERTVAALRALPEGSRLTAFLFPDEFVELQVFGSPALPRAFARLRSLLEDARIRAGGRVEVLILDPASAPIRIQEVRERSARELREVLVLETGEQRRKLRLEDLFLFSQPTPRGEPARLLQDRVDPVLGNAALRLARRDLPRVGLVTGLHDVPLDSENGLAPFAREIVEAQGYELLPVAAPADAPGDLDLLVFLGQQRPFTPQDRAFLESWLAAGKPLFLALGSGAPPGVVRTWNELLAPRGLGFLEVEGTEHPFLCEPFNGETGISRCAELRLRPDRMSAAHPVTRPLVEAPNPVPAWAPACRPLELRPAAEFLREELCGTTTEAWVEVDGDFRPTDRRREPTRRYGAAAAAERWEPLPGGLRGRSFLMGSALAWHGAGALLNRALGTAALRWLLQEEEAPEEFVPVEARVYRPEPEVQARLARRLRLGLPAIPFLLSLLLAWIRRR